mgnify:CR=1 FL=1
MLKVGVSPLTGLLLASKSVTVTVEVATPLATTGPEPVIVEVATAAAPAEESFCRAESLANAVAGMSTQEYPESPNANENGP